MTRGEWAGRWAALLLVALVGCTGADDYDVGEGEEPDCGPSTPLVTYETFGEGFVSTYCQGCHASTALNRQGAPDALTFDSKTDVFRHQSSILNAAATDVPTMPPNGGPTADDRELLDIWLTCFVEDE